MDWLWRARGRRRAWFSTFGTKEVQSGACVPGLAFCLQAMASCRSVRRAPRLAGNELRHPGYQRVLDSRPVVAERSATPLVPPRSIQSPGRARAEAAARLHVGFWQTRLHGCHSVCHPDRREPITSTT